MPLREVAEALRATPSFRGNTTSSLPSREYQGRSRRAQRPALCWSKPGQPLRSYLLVLDGEIRADRPEPDGSRTMMGIAASGEGFGEAPLLMGKTEFARSP